MKIQYNDKMDNVSKLGFDLEIYIHSHIEPHKRKYNDANTKTKYYY